MAEYEIVIRNETAQESAGAPVSGEKGAEYSVRPHIATDTGGATSEARRAVQSKPSDTKPLISAKTIVPFITSAIDFQISTAEMRTGSTEYQQRLELARRVTGEVVSAGTSIAAGAATAGPAGAAVAATLELLKWVSELAQNAERIALQREIESESLTELTRRAGMGLSKYRRG